MQQNIKIAVLNILNGCFDGFRIARIIEFVRMEKFDVLGLLELNFWNVENYKKLKWFMSKTKYKYFVFCEAYSGYNLAILSKYPFDSYQIKRKNFHTGVIQANINFKGMNLEIVLCHLTYESEDKRLLELNKIFATLGSKNVILMGDFNSLSPLDEYNEENIIEKFKVLKFFKFGYNFLEKKVINFVLKHGFIDAVKEFSENLEYTVPSSINKDKAHLEKLRLDYIFISKNLQNKLTFAYVPRGNNADILSDHFPVVAEINL